MKFNSLLFPFFCLVASVGNTEENEIRVELTTQSKLIPTYISQMSVSGALIDASYAKKLEDVLRRDVHMNGETKLLDISIEKEKFCKESFSERSLWKAQGVVNVIKLEVKDGSLSAHVFNTASGSLKHYRDIALTGNINLDRRKMHTLADQIHLSLFGKEGIAATRILYSFYVPMKGDQNEWIAEIWECDWDGMNSRQVTHDKNYNISPVYIPPTKGEHGSDKFVYVSYKQGQPKIYRASLDRGNGARLVEIRGNQLLPSVSSDQRRTAFICDASGRADLFMQIDGEEKPAQLFSFPRSTQASPTFSPDGSKIAFVSDKDGAPRIYIIAAKASKKRQEAMLITRKTREATCPSWSPDGTKLAYSARVDGVRQIWVYDFESAEEKQLTIGPGNKENPAWAPNSHHIVFNSVDGEKSELFIIALSQTDAIKISKGPGKKHYPSWG